jgi:hypothetical protein
MPLPQLNQILLRNCINWFIPEFNRKVFQPLQGQFPNYPLPKDIQVVNEDCARLNSDIRSLPEGEFFPEKQVFAEKMSARLPLFRQIVLHYRRHWAALTEERRDKTAHAELIETLERDLRALDGLVSQEWFQEIEETRIPRLGDFLALQYVEDLLGRELALPTRAYDQKFHILQAPIYF